VGVDGYDPLTFVHHVIPAVYIIGHWSLRSALLLISFIHKTLLFIVCLQAASRYYNLVHHRHARVNGVVINR